MQRIDCEEHALIESVPDTAQCSPQRLVEDDLAFGDILSFRHGTANDLMRCSVRHGIQSPRIVIHGCAGQYFIGSIDEAINDLITALFRMSFALKCLIECGER